MHICLTSEENLLSTPPGGIAEQQLAVAKALRTLGHRVSMVAAVPAGAEGLGRSAARRLSKLALSAVGGGDCDLYDLRTSSGIELLLVDFASSGVPGAPAHAWQAAVAACQQRLLQADGLHMVAAWPTNAASQPSSFEAGVPCWWSVTDGGASGAAAASEAATALPHGVPCLVPSRSAKQAWHLPEAHVVPQGIDVGVWNPSVDVHLPSRFDAIDRSGKGRCKQALQLELELPLRLEVPLVLLWSADAQAVQGVAQRLPWADVLRNDLQVVVCGIADGALQVWQDEQPLRLRAVGQAKAEQVHRLVAASDLLLVPGAGQQAELACLVGQRYGALPIVADHLWTRDRFVDCDPQLTTGNAWLVEEEGGEAWLAALQRGVAAHAQGEAFAALQQRVMRLDASAERQARMQVALYEMQVPAAAQPENGR